MDGTKFGTPMVVAISLVLPALALSQAAQRTRTLIVSGHSGETPIVEMNDRSYVEIEALARMVNGSLRYEGNRVFLTLRGSSASGTQNAASANPGFSKDFLNAGIELMASIREWRTALVNAIERGYPVTEDWMAVYRGQASKNLRLASVAASTDDDRKAVPFLTNEFNYMNKLSDRFLEKNRARSYVPPNALKDDDLDHKIVNCEHALAAMAASGRFVDEPACQ